MKHSDEINALAAALAKAQSSFSPVIKSKTAKVRTKAGGEFQYHYADLADILAMALPILSANGLAFVQSVEREDNLIVIDSMLAHSSGQWISSAFKVAVSSEDRMSAIQAAGSAITYARRYTASSMLGIASEEDDDGQGAGSSQRPANASARPQGSNTTAQPSPTQPAQAAPSQRQTQPYADAEEIKTLRWTLDNALRAGAINQTVYNAWLPRLVPGPNLKAVSNSIMQQWGNLPDYSGKGEASDAAGPDIGDGNEHDLF